MKIQKYFLKSKINKLYTLIYALFNPVINRKQLYKTITEKSTINSADLILTCIKSTA